MELTTLELAHPDKIEYMKSRRGTFEFRSRTRYAAVAEKLVDLGLDDGDLIVDLGAGTCQFDHYLRTVLGWSGRYLPIDAVVCGTRLEAWVPKYKADFFVAIEVLEHLDFPGMVISRMMAAATKGCVVTTPNSRVVDVIACDPTHKSSLPAKMFDIYGWQYQERQFFATPNDSLLAWRSAC